jgi:hypothetical protein
VQSMRCKHHCLRGRPQHVCTPPAHKEDARMCGERQWQAPGVSQSVVPAALLACTVPLVVPVALRLVCTWGYVGNRLTL